MDLLAIRSAGSIQLADLFKDGGRRKSCHHRNRNHFPAGGFDLRATHDFVAGPVATFYEPKIDNDDDIVAASSETKLSKMIAVEARNACAIMD